MKGRCRDRLEMHGSHLVGEIVKDILYVGFNLVIFAVLMFWCYDQGRRRG